MDSFEEVVQDTTSPPTSNDDVTEPVAAGDDDEEEEEDEEEGDDDATVPREYDDENNSNDKHVCRINAVPTLDSLTAYRDLNSDVVCWQLSTAKPGNGVEQLLDSSSETYWQSDGQTQPHWIQIHLSRRVAVSHVCLYVDFPADESYTPKKVTVHAGMTHQDLWHATTVELIEPTGWCILPLQSPPDPLDDVGEDDDEDDAQRVESKNDDDDDDNDSNLVGTTQRYNQRNVIRAHLIRISVQSMHQNGRDTHVRKLRLFGPRMNHQWPADTMLRSVSPERQAKNHRESTRSSLGFDNLFSSIR